MTYHILIIIFPLIKEIGDDSGKIRYFKLQPIIKETSISFHYLTFMRKGSMSPSFL